MSMSSLANMSITNPGNDPLSDGPPAPPARTARRPSAPASSNARGSMDGAAHLLGAGGAMRPIELMMNLENIIKELMQFRPDIGALFAAPIGQARDMLAGSMADIAQGGPGGIPAQDAGLPPPQMGGPAPGMAGPMPPPPPGAMM